MVRSVYLFSPLSEGCHPQVLGHLLHWSCGGGSTAHVTRLPFWLRCSHSRFGLFTAVVLAAPGSLYPSSCDVSSTAAAAAFF